MSNLFIIRRLVEPRAGLGPATCRFLHRYHVVGFACFIPHHTARFWGIFGRFCSEVAHKNVSATIRNLTRNPAVTTTALRPCSKSTSVHPLFTAAVPDYQ